MRRPRLNVLRTFESAGRLLSFSRAAEELNITQAAVSQQIRNLEAFLDADLFIRSHRSLSLTYTGAAYLNVVHEALDRLDSITDQLFPDRSHQHVTLRCTSSVATLWLAPQLGSFQKLYPNIDLRIRTMDGDLEDTFLNTGKNNIIVLSENSTAKGATKLLDIIVTPVCSPNLIETQKRPQFPADLLDFDLIHTLGYQDDWHRWFRNFLDDDMAIPGRLSVDSSMFALEAALRGDGIILGRRPFIDKHLESGNLVEVFCKPFHLHTRYYVHQNSSLRNSKAIQSVIDWLKELSTPGMAISV